MVRQKSLCIRCRNSWRPGIDIVGPLPLDLQGTFLFSAALMADVSEVKAAKALMKFLCTPEARALIKAKGMEPVISRVGLSKRRD
jgi:hypothetical protein